MLLLIPLAVRSKVYVCGRSIAGIADSKPAEDMDVCLFVLLVCCAGSSLCNELNTPSEEP